MEELRRDEETRQKKDSSLIEMNLDNGTQKIKGQSYGIYLMEEK